MPVVWVFGALVIATTMLLAVCTHAIPLTLPPDYIYMPFLRLGSIVLSLSLSRVFIQLALSALLLPVLLE